MRKLMLGVAALAAIAVASPAMARDGHGGGGRSFGGGGHAFHGGGAFRGGGIGVYGGGGYYSGGAYDDYAYSCPLVRVLRHGRVVYIQDC
jgi:hypothetical protein